MSEEQAERATPSPRLAARFLSVVLCLVGAKAVLVATNARFVSSALWQPPFWWAQDLLLAGALGVLLVLGQRFSAGLAYGLSAVVVLVNAMLTIIAQEVRAYYSPRDPLPEFDAQWFQVMQDYTSPASASLMIGTILVLAFGPRLLARRQRLIHVLHQRRRPVVVGGVLYGAVGLIAFLAPQLSALRIHRNPVAYYLSEIVVPTGLFDLTATPAGPAALAPILQTVAPVPAEPALLTAEQVAALPEANVLLVVMESVGHDALETAADGTSNHPFLAAHGAEALVFDNYQTAAPHSASSLESIHCAEYRLPHATNGKLLARCEPLPKRLAAAGLKTAFFQSTYFGDWIPESFFQAMGYGETYDAQGIARLAAAAGQPIELSAGIAQEKDTAAATRRWMSAQCAAGEHWMATWYTWVAHSPYPKSHAADQPFDEGAPAKTRHRQLIRVLDHEIGLTYAMLQATPCGGRPTVLVVTGDHGEAFFEHPGNQYHTAYPYQENLRVPLYIFLPSRQGGRSSLPGSHVDLARTLADLALGRARATPVVDAEPALGGRSLLDATEQRPVFAHSLLGEGMVSVRFGPYKLIQSPELHVLFNLDDDPGEQVDVTGRHPALADALALAINRWAADLRTRASPP